MKFWSDIDCWHPVSARENSLPGLPDKLLSKFGATGSRGYV